MAFVFKSKAINMISMRNGVNQAIWAQKLALKCSNLHYFMTFNKK